MESLVNAGEYLSAHYLAEVFPKELRANQAKEWAKREPPTPRSRLRGLRSEFFAARAALAHDADKRNRAGPDADPAWRKNLTALHDKVLYGFGFDAVRDPITVVRAGIEYEIPVAHHEDGIVAIECGWATDVDAALDSTGAGQLAEPVPADSGKILRTGAELVGFLFGADDPPRYALILVGGVVILADRTAWHEGRYLAVNLDTALGRNDTAVAGELDIIAALFHAESLRTPPSGGETALAGVLDASTKHAVGVSSELRHGLRRSVELIANEVLARLRDAGCGVASIPSPRDFAKTLTLESLRYLYRIVFLLYAEARPELGILPVDHPEYVDGYGLGRLGELVTPRHIDEAASAGFHLYESLDMLFGLVNTGYRPVGEDPTPEVTSAKRSEGEGLRFEAMRSDLFSPQKITLIGRDTVNPADPGGPRIDTRLRNETLYQVLRLLMLTRGRKSDKKDGSGRAKVKERGGFISYAQLGINQLGAVYEGLMSYTGSIAHEDLYEVAKNGDPSGGSWVIPVRDADKYPDDEDNSVFVKREDEDTGQKTRVKYETGQFVYRLAGRDRQVSASYYTPESLTKVTVQLTLEQRIKENGEHTAARELLDWRICEPALGSGAFLNEAINQVAAEYLRRRQAELGELIPPEDYDTELRKVKAYLALHNSYGVDLNGTAVELAEVSLWLNVMHPGLKAPWFGLHLRRGNSLIGAARRYYSAEQVNDAGWRRAKDTLAPTDLPFKDGPLPEGGVYHFLLPSPGWAAVADEKEAKRLAPEAAKALSDWRKAMLRKPKAGQVRRLQELSRSVESLWKLVVRRLELSEREISRRIDVWGADDLREPVENIDRTDVLVGLRHEGSPYWRLKTLMDAWCAFWFWPVTQPAPEVSLDAWLDFAEALVGKVSDGGLISEPTTLAEMDDLEDGMVGLLAMDTTAALPKRFGWFRTAQAIAEEQGFFHWELDFAHVFASEAAGFDIQVGNPPWVRPDWNEGDVLAERVPWFALAVRPSAENWRRHKSAVLDTQQGRAEYLQELARNAGLVASLRSVAAYPILTGTRPDMYRGFMCRTWANRSNSGAIGLLHPDSHFQGVREGRLRAAAYKRLWIHAHFVNESNWAFSEPDHKMEFGLHVYGRPHQVRFQNLSYLYDAGVLVKSLTHKGIHGVPGQKLNGSWDIRPHQSRVIEVTEELLAQWHRLNGNVDAGVLEAPLLYPITTREQSAITALADSRLRIGESAKISIGFLETSAKAAGTIRWAPGVRQSWEDVILQGPHLAIATPFAKQPPIATVHNSDWLMIDLTRLSSNAIPWSAYERACSKGKYIELQDKWEGLEFTAYYRLAWRSMVYLRNERSLFPALIPPGPAHVHAVESMALPTNRETSLCAGFWASLPLDYMLRVSGRTHLQVADARTMPAPETNHPLASALLLRSLRLNCLTEAYAPLWDELYEPTWPKAEGWAVDWPRLGPPGAVRPNWAYDTPLRTEYERRAALVELDALVSVWLGIDIDSLVAVYRSRYPILADREERMYFDANGRKLAADSKAFGYGQTKEDYTALMAHLDEGAPPPAGYRAPFYKADRVREMREAHASFARRLAEAQ